MANFKKVVNILHTCIFCFAVAAGVCLADTGCLKCGTNYIENQFIDGVVYGWLTISVILFTAIFFNEDQPQKTIYLITCGGGCLNIIAGIILILDQNTIRLLITGVLVLANGAIFLFEFIALLVKPSLLD